jgi:hypothetical protein
MYLPVLSPRDSLAQGATEFLACFLMQRSRLAEGAVRFPLCHGNFRPRPDLQKLNDLQDFI